MQVSAEVLHALTTALSAAFTKGVGRVNPQYRSIATVIPSSGASNTYGWVEDFPTIKEWIGARQLK
ncbi:Mu-like prophage major head subunit gpT family protein, partial [Citrobacter freundii]